MKFFLDLHHAYEATVKSSNNHKNTSPPPDWFIFSDDDYFMRVHMLEAILKKHGEHPRENKYALIKTETAFGMWLWNKNCTVPCMHRVGWLSWAGYSIGALKHMEQSLRDPRSNLVALCHRWSVSHDVGLGAYTWTFPELSAIRIKSLKKKDIMQDTEGILDHHSLVAWDRIIESQWHSAASNYMLKNANFLYNYTFDIELFVAYEKTLGHQYAMNNDYVVKWNQSRHTMRYKRYVSNSSTQATYLQLFGPDDCAEDFNNYISHTNDAVKTGLLKCDEKF